ncbi:MAG: hypothetical protein RIS11_1026, partial [Pseudomonadota bacterium]
MRRKILLVLATTSLVACVSNNGALASSQKAARAPLPFSAQEKATG